MSGLVNTPWIIGRTRGDKPRVLDSQSYIIASSVCAGLTYQDERHERAEQHARLIAASPDMLAALKLAKPVLAEELEVRLKSAEPMPADDEAAGIEQARIALVAVCEAIAKAEGPS